jgi:hypothetical protein
MRRFYEGHRSVVQALLALAAVSAVAYFAGYRPLEDRTGDTIHRVTRLENASPCRPDSHGHPVNPKACMANFSSAVKTLTTAQACRIVRKGAMLLVVNGSRVNSVECRFPSGQVIGTGRNGHADPNSPAGTDDSGTSSATSGGTSPQPEQPSNPAPPPNPGGQPPGHQPPPSPPTGTPESPAPADPPRLTQPLDPIVQPVTQTVCNALGLCVQLP